MDSRCFPFTLGGARSQRISFLHFWCLWVGREILNILVLRIHPRTVFCSSMHPSAVYFFKEMMSFLGMISESLRGLARVWMAKGKPC